MAMTKANPYQIHGGVLGTHDPCIVNISGGRSSGYMLRQILDAYPDGVPDDVHFVFTNTGREMPETLDFVAEMARRWAAPIVWLERDPDVAEGYREVGHNSASREGEPFERLIRDRKYLPNRVARFCTSELKIAPSKKWMQARGYETWAGVLGFRADEKRRLLGAQKKDGKKQPWYTLAPMVDAGVTKREVTAFWRSQPFDLRLPNIRGATPLGNCDGCFLKGDATLAGICRSHPERFDWWVRMEREIVEMTGTGDAKTFRGADRRSHTNLAAFTRDQGDLLADLPDDADGIDCFCTGD
jgi:3'-phosphoadenosine 5'-phosphosulfate sulfotransferase (PAPS reductase)/FAD synthetase